MIAPSRLPEPRLLRLALRADEAADALGVSPRTLAAMVAANTIPHVYIGTRNLRFPVAALQKWLDAQTAMPAAMVVLGREQQDGLADDPNEEAPQGANRDANLGRQIR